MVVAGVVMKGLTVVAAEAFKPVGQVGERLLRIRVKVKADDEAKIREVFMHSGTTPPGVSVRVDLRDDMTPLENEIHTSQKVPWFDRKKFSLADVRKICEDKIRAEIRCGFGTKPGRFGIRICSPCSMTRDAFDKEYADLQTMFYESSATGTQSQGKFEYETELPPDVDSDLVINTFATEGWQLLGVQVTGDKFSNKTVKWLLRSNVPQPNEDGSGYRRWQFGLVSVCVRRINGKKVETKAASKAANARSRTVSPPPRGVASGARVTQKR